MTKSTNDLERARLCLYGVSRRPTGRAAALHEHAQIATPEGIIVERNL